MKSVILLLSVTTYAKALLFDLANSLLPSPSDDSLSLGPLDASVHVGTLPHPYQPLTADDQVASYNAAGLAEFIRPLMTTGIESMPPLDPYRRPAIGPLQVINLLDLVSVDVTAKNLVITGIQQFRLHSVEMRLQNPANYRTDVNVSVPHVGVTTDFAVLVQLPLLKLPPIKGHVELLLQNLKVEAATAGKELLHARTDYGRYFPGTLQQDALHAYGKVSDLQLKLNLRNPVLNLAAQTALKLFSFLIPFVYALIKPITNALVFNMLGREVILPQINEILKPITFEQALAFLLHTPPVVPYA